MPEKIMSLMPNIYTNLKHHNKWGVLSTNEEKKMALSSELVTIKDTNLKLSQAILNVSKSTNKKTEI